MGPELVSYLQSTIQGEFAHSLNPMWTSVLRLAGILTPPNYLTLRRKKWEDIIALCVSQFAQLGYAPVSGMIHPLHLSALRRYYRHLIRTGGFELGDAQNSRRYGIHNEPVARFFHHQLTALMSAIAGQQVKPSYVYFAAYQEGAELMQHTDRPQCEFSITFCVDYSPEPRRKTSWPIVFETLRGKTTVFQAIGDGLFYRGCQLPHSRPKIPSGHTSTSIFFHYVPEDFDGPLD
jgi:hypothetical protein